MRAETESYISNHGGNGEEGAQESGGNRRQVLSRGNEEKWHFYWEGNSKD